MKTLALVLITLGLTLSAHADQFTGIWVTTGQLNETQYTHDTAGITIQEPYFDALIVKSNGEATTVETDIYGLTPLVSVTYKTKVLSRNEIEITDDYGTSYTFFLTAKGNLENMKSREIYQPMTARNFEKLKAQFRDYVQFRNATRNQIWNQVKGKTYTLEKTEVISEKGTTVVPAQPFVFFNEVADQTGRKHFVPSVKTIRFIDLLTAVVNGDYASGLYLDPIHDTGELKPDHVHVNVWTQFSNTTPGVGTEILSGRIQLTDKGFSVTYQSGALKKIQYFVPVIR